LQIEEPATSTIKEKVKPTVIKPEMATFAPELSEPELIIDEKESAPEIVTEKALTPDPIPAVPEKIVTQKMYHLIGGSFESLDNAESLISICKTQGYENSMVIGQAANGYFRVSISAYARKSEAITELEKVRVSLNPGAWILRQ
jgi:cell division protein FtsN